MNPPDRCDYWPYWKLCIVEHPRWGWQTHLEHFCFRWQTQLFRHYQHCSTDANYCDKKWVTIIKKTFDESKPHMRPFCRARHQKTRQSCKLCRDKSSLSNSSYSASRWAAFGISSSANSIRKLMQSSYSRSKNQSFSLPLAVFRQKVQNTTNNRFNRVRSDLRSIVKQTLNETWAGATDEKKQRYDVWLAIRLPFTKKPQNQTLEFRTAGPWWCNGMMSAQHGHTT